MFNRSHSRSSYPHDKMIPKMPKKSKVKEQFVRNGVVVQEFEHYVGYGSTVRQVKKNMHKKKQRQYNQKLEREYIHE